MQTQKQPVKNKIVGAALEEFLIAGYSNSSMRNIATQSGITVGNIYSYFSSKEDLFEYLLTDILKELQSLLQIEVNHNGIMTPQNITDMAHYIAGVFFKNRIQFLILMDGSAGSKYANIKSTLIEQASARILLESIHRKTGKVQFDPILAQSLAVAIIEGMINIFRRTGKDKKKLENLLSDFLALILGDFYA